MYLEQRSVKLNVERREMELCEVVQLTIDLKQSSARNHTCLGSMRTPN